VTPAPAELDLLRSMAERAMREDAAPADAAARERLLQMYRDRMVDFGHFDLSGTLKREDACGEEDVGGVEWLARLGAAGHVPARALLERALDDRRLSELTTAAPGRMAALVDIVPPLARREALGALRGTDTDYPRIARLLAAAGGACGQVGNALRTLIGLGVAVREDERELLRVSAKLYTQVPVTDARAARELLTRFATRRIVSADAGERGEGERLLAHAARADPPRAPVLEWLGRLVAKAPQFMREWLGKNPDPLEASKLWRVRAGAAFETGRATGTPDLAEASRWYAFAVDGTPETGGEGGAGNPKLCYSAAKQIELQLLGDQPELKPYVLAWYQRGAALGEERCVAALAGRSRSG